MVETGTSSDGRKSASASAQVDKQTRKASSTEQTHGTHQRQDLENGGFAPHHPDKQPEVCIRQCFQRKLQIQRESLSHISEWEVQPYSRCSSFYSAMNYLTECPAAHARAFSCCLASLSYEVLIEVGSPAVGIGTQGITVPPPHLYRVWDSPRFTFVCVIDQYFLLCGSGRANTVVFFLKHSIFNWIY